VQVLMLAVVDSPLFSGTSDGVVSFCLDVLAILVRQFEAGMEFRFFRLVTVVVIWFAILVLLWWVEIQTP